MRIFIRAMWVFAFNAFIFFPSINYAEPITESAMLSITCNGCHGTDGKSPGSIPAIAGKSAAYIEKVMLDFRNDVRPSSIMKRHAKGYSDTEIKLIAEYFATKK